MGIFFWREVLLTLLRPASVSRRLKCGRLMCGCNSFELNPVWTCILYVGSVRGATVLDLASKRHNFAKISEDGDSTRFPDVAFPSSGESEKPIDCNNASGSSVVNWQDFWIFTWVFCTMPLIRWCLLHEPPTYGASSVSSLKGSGSGVCMLSTAFRSGRNVCLYPGSNDFALL